MACLVAPRHQNTPPPATPPVVVAANPLPAPEAPAPRPQPAAPQPPAPVEPVEPFVPKAQPPSPEPPRPAPALEPVRFKRRDTLTAEELRKQLVLVPEIGLDYATCKRIVSQANAHKDVSKHPTLVVLGARRADLGDLPVAMGAECQIGKDAADALQGLSRKLRIIMAASADPIGVDPRINSETLRQRLAGSAKLDRIVGAGRPRGGPGDGAPAEAGADEWLQPESVPTLTQLLMAEDRPLRTLLVELLARIAGKEATQALARRAVFDLSPEVREASVEALRNRPDRDLATPIFLQGLRYPWPPAADHAAEALVNLKATETAPELVRLLGERSPNAPFRRDGAAADGTRRLRELGDPFQKDEDEGVVVREVVRLNHLANCVTCHAPAVSRDDPVRGLIPTPGQPVPPTFQPQYYSRDDGLFVRADVTYLRQDFSAPQPVASPNNWPANQRYDYLVRVRPATKAERLAQAQFGDPAHGPQREAVLFALRNLTARDLGDSTEAWQQALAQPGGLVRMDQK